jgi:uncharacterized protein (TIGR00369 family)
MFDRASFIGCLGLELKSYGDGRAVSSLKVESEHLQQHGFVHAGAQATMCDHTAGVAATTVLAENEQVLTIEFKVNFLRPASGQSLECLSRVVRRGKTLVFAESEVFAIQGSERKLTATASITLAVTEIYKAEKN